MHQSEISVAMPYCFLLLLVDVNKNVYQYLEFFVYESHLIVLSHVDVSSSVHVNIDSIE